MLSPGTCSTTMAGRPSGRSSPVRVEDDGGHRQAGARRRRAAAAASSRHRARRVPARPLALQDQRPAVERERPRLSGRAARQPPEPVDRPAEHRRELAGERLGRPHQRRLS